MDGRRRPQGAGPGPLTLAIDVGGSGLKASVLDAAGAMTVDRVRVATPYPLPPERLVDSLVELVAPLGAYDRVSLGFPGMVRDGVVRTAPNLATEEGPGSPTDPAIADAWDGFALAEVLTERLGRPTRVLNDADLQGGAVVQGEGLEMVVTLGTGFGTALYHQGRLCPHLELGHHPFREDETYDEQLGDVARRHVGRKRWNRRVREAIAILHVLCRYDHLYVGGGNAKHLEGDLGPRVSVVDNKAGILGGIKLWEDGSGGSGG